MTKRKIIPNEVRQKVGAFIAGERGQVSKQSLLSLGAFLGSAAIGGILASSEVKAGQVRIDVTAQGGHITSIRGVYV